MALDLDFLKKKYSEMLGGASNVVMSGAANVQNWLESPTSRVNIPVPTVDPVTKSYKSIVESVLTETPKTMYDISKGIAGLGSALLGKDTSRYKPTSAAGKFGQELVTTGVRVGQGQKLSDILGDTVGYYGAGKTRVPLTNIRLPEFGISESTGFNLLKGGVKAFEAPLAATGGKYPLQMFGYSLLGGGISAGSNVLFDKKKDPLGSFYRGTMETAEKAPLMVGGMKATAPLTSVGGLPLQSATNVGQGILLDISAGYDTTPESVLLDLIMPGASKVAGNVIKQLKNKLSVKNAVKEIQDTGTLSDKAIIDTVNDINKAGGNVTADEVRQMVLDPVSKQKVVTAVTKGTPRIEPAIPKGVVGETFVIPKVGKPMTKIQAKREALKAMNIEPNKPIALLPAGPNVSKSEVYNKLANIENYIGGRTATEEELQKGIKVGAGKVSDKLRQIAENTSIRVGELTASENPVLRSMGRIMQGLFGGLGKTELDVEAKRRLMGKMGYSTYLAEKLQNYVQKDLLGNNKQSAEKLFSILDPELAKAKVDFTDLADNEKEALSVLRQMSDFINDLNFQNGLVSYQNWYKNRGGKYIARAYEPYEFPAEVSDYVKQWGVKMDLSGTQKREVLDTWKEENAIKDPVFLMAKRIQQAVFNDAIGEWSNYMKNTKYVSDVAKPGYDKLSDSRVYGELAGKYIRKDFMEDIKGFYFTNDSLDKLYSLFRDYSRNPVTRTYKKLLTVFNPATQLGNTTGNFFFATINGLNPVNFARNYKSAFNDIRSNSPLYKKMMQDGLVMNDITKDDIIKLSTELKSGVKDKNILQKIDEVASKVYGGSDDLAKVAAMKTWLDRGYSYSEASRRVFNSFQNYSTVGFLYNIGANIPVLGNPFVRFKADVLRILKNSAIDHPFALAGTVGAISALGTATSILSGETPENRATREQRVGAQRIPFTNVSLNLQTPFGEISTGRLLGFYNANTTADSQFFNDLSTYSPFPIPELSPEGIKNPQDMVNDPVLGPLVSAYMLDKDFRGKTISDPEANKYTGSLLTPQQKTMNQLNYLRRAYQGPVINSLEDVASAVQGKEDFYGRTLTPAQAILRAFPGIKVEEYGAEKAELARERNRYYETQRQDAIDDKMKAVTRLLIEGKIDEQTYNERISYWEKNKQENPSIKETQTGEGYIFRDGVLSFINENNQNTTIDTKKFQIENTDTPQTRLQKEKLKNSSVKKVFNDLGLSDLQKSEMLQLMGVAETDIYDNQYGVNDVKAIEGTDTISEIRRSNMAYDKVVNIMKDQEAGLLTPEIAQGLFDRMGITREGADYYYTASQDQNIRFELIKQTIEQYGDDREALLEALAPLRQKVNGKMVLNDNLISELYNEGFIDKNMKKVLQAIMIKDGKVVFEQGFKGTGDGTVASKKLVTAQKKAIKEAVKATAKLVKPRKAQFRIARERRAKIKVKPVTVSGIKVFTSKPISVKNIAQLSSNKVR